MTLKTIAHNLYQLDFNGLAIWFSYQTPIAIYSDKLYISKNIWSSTTGKHLNIINPDKDIRIEHNEVLNKINEAVKR